MNYSDQQSSLIRTHTYTTLIYNIHSIISQLRIYSRGMHEIASVASRLFHRPRMRGATLLDFLTVVHIMINELGD